MNARVRRVLSIALPVLIVGYAAALRFAALTESYGAVTSPAWLRAVQISSTAPLRAIRPDAVEWTPVPLYPHRDGVPTRYKADPYTYLNFAREMRAFSAAHHREPLFPYVTRTFLRLLNDQDVAVSFASMAFSVLAVLATYLLGAYAFSRFVGAVAALALAIEYEVVSIGVSGGRDDAFMAGVVLCAYAFVRHARAPSRATAILIGVCAGLTCLVRITALSFLVPAFGGLLLARGRPLKARAIDLGIAVVTALVIVGPYVVNCWRVYGDPLYAINYHTRNYLDVEAASADAMATWSLAGASVPDPPDMSEAGAGSRGALGYVAVRFRERPFDTVDTLISGLTTYPFQNKWTGFDSWIPRLGVWLAWAALAGLVLFAGSPPGRWLLLIVIASLVPFAPTWKLLSDWRFTAHVYPLFLIAAAVAIAQVAAAAATIVRRPRSVAAPRRAGAVFWVAVLGAIAAGVWIFNRALPWLIVRESLRLHDPVTIGAGSRDAAFFGPGWSKPVVRGNVTLRFAESDRATISFPSPGADDYFVTLRIDPEPAPAEDPPGPLPVVQATLNGTIVSKLDLRWTPGRVGSYDVTLPRHLVRDGINRLRLAAVGGQAPRETFGLWYVRIRPSAMREVSDPMMALDLPANGASVPAGRPFSVAGWAVDRGASRDTGVTAVRIYAFPIVHDSFGPAVPLGQAMLGLARPDVAAAVGARFTNPGFAMSAAGLTAGSYRVVAFARSAVTGRFNQSRATDITVTPPVPEPLMVVDTPVAGPCRQPCVVAGWAIDRGAAGGTGVDLVRVEARPERGGRPVELGTAVYGLPRPDIAAAFGDRFRNAGYSFTVNGLSAGTKYELRVSARSTMTGAFNQRKSVIVVMR